VNPTGAGDIFAAAFLFRLHQTKGNPWEAAEFANHVAATSVAQLTLNEKLNSIREVLGRED
jgi:sugar/nucleoside kinase (ribokinase family)